MEPDSTSRRESVPSRSERLCSRSTLKTLAASGDATTEPSSRPPTQSMPRAKCAKTPVTPAVKTTPTVERSIAGTATGRQILLFTGLVIVLCLVLKPLGTKLPAPTLLIFIALGMLLGVDGPAHIDFSDYALTESVCSTALLFIMFYGGFNTKKNFKWCKQAIYTPLHERSIQRTSEGLNVIMTAFHFTTNKKPRRLFSAASASYFIWIFCYRAFVLSYNELGG